MTIREIIALSLEIITLLGFMVAAMRKINKIANGTKCQLRTAMLNTYYANKDKKTIKEYELQNFTANFEAYVALDGNMFVDRIKEEVLEWEVIR